MTSPQPVLVTTLDEKLVDLNHSARELLSLENEIVDSQLLESILNRLHADIRKLIRLQKVSIEIEQNQYLLMYLHDSREKVYSQRLLSFFATTLKSLDKPSNVTTDCQSFLLEASRTAVADLCDWCRIDLRSDLNLGRGVVAHSDMGLESYLSELQKIDFQDSDDLFCPYRVIRSGLAVFRDDVTDELLKVLSVAPRTFALMQKMGLSSYICVPIKKADDTIGSLTFARSPGSAKFDSIDLLMAEEFAIKLGLNIERTLLYKNLAEMRNAAEAANRAKTNFLANVSHEIRTPLGAIVGFSELLATTNSSPEDRNDWGNKIRVNSGRLLRIVDDILDLSKIEAGKLDLEIKRIDLKNLLQELFAYSLRKASVKNIEIDFLIEEPLPRFIFSDETRLSQILFNILGNAIKFTTVGSVKMKVGKINAGSSGAHEQHLYFEITDTGIGVGEQQATLLFQPFSQADSSYTRQFGGTGLGLALSRTLAQRLGGNLILKESRLDHGSKFLITINARSVPYAETFQDLHSTEASVTSAVAEDDMATALQKKSILLVEDSVDIQVLVKRMLEGAGAQISIAENGEEGIKAAMANSYDIVLMDVQMPVKDGCQAVQELRLLGYKGIVMALTANAMKEEHDRCIAAGFDAHLSKPMRRRELIRSILRISEDHQRKRI